MGEVLRMGEALITRIVEQIQPHSRAAPWLVETVVRQKTPGSADALAT
jgi:hypothetical protein